MELIQYAFTAVLISVLLAASAAFTVMGMGKVRRRRRLARQAHEHGLKFFPEDPYDVPRRYADFAVISSGHSPCANNVTSGGVGARPVRAFDFRCELGHGTRRLTRLYSVAVGEARRDLGTLLMWHTGDADLAPLAARGAALAVGPWSCIGSPDLARTVQHACQALADARPSIEVRGPVVLVAAPVSRSVRNYALGVEDMGAILDAMEKHKAIAKEPAAR